MALADWPAGLIAILAGLSESLPPHVRVRFIGIIYALAIAIFGGSARSSSPG